MRPTPLLPAPVARLAAFAAFALVGALQWQRYTAGGSAGRAVLWVAAALAAATLVARARTPRALAGALVAGGALSLVTSGLALQRLLPGRWDTLAAGLAEGSQAFASVRLPYAGADPWVIAVVELSGAGLCWLGAVLAVWPHGGSWARTLALVTLLTLAMSPLVSLGTDHATTLGAALTVLVVAFLWLERLARRGIAGIVVLGALAVAVAAPLAGVANRERPLFDYQAFSERFGAGAPIGFDWTQRYGPIDWPREGAEVMRVRSAGGRPLYLKAEQLDAFDGAAWTVGSGLGIDADELARDWRDHPEWDVRVAVTLRRLKTSTLPSPGTTLSVESATEAVQPDAVPGPWIVPYGRSLDGGDSYVLNAHVPDPSPSQLRGATVDLDSPGAGALQIDLPLDGAAQRAVPVPPGVTDRVPTPPDRARVTFPSWSSPDAPQAFFRAFGTSTAAPALLRRSGYARTWALAQRLKAGTPSPYDYVLRVSQALKGPRFRYTETPPDPGGREPLEAFLFDSQAGYCQQYAGAMALLLRMGGVPARVATGFSPGGRRGDSGEWIVRDTDAHAWVEAWFDGFGWVTLDPTPPDTQARTLAAAVATPTPVPVTTPEPARDAARPAARQPGGIVRDAPAAPTAAASETRRGRDDPPWALLLALAAGLSVVAAAWRARARDRPAGHADDRLAELQRALRRSGRAVDPATTLAGLERRLGAEGDAAAYLRALQADRFGADPAPPTGAQRAAFRRELGAGLGAAGRARAWLALPPRLPSAVRFRRTRPR